MIHLFFPFHMSDHYLAKGLSLSSIHDSGIRSILIPGVKKFYKTAKDRTSVRSPKFLQVAQRHWALWVGIAGGTVRCSQSDSEYTYYIISIVYPEYFTKISQKKISLKKSALWCTLNLPHPLTILISPHSIKYHVDHTLIPSISRDKPDY